MVGIGTVFGAIRQAVTIRDGLITPIGGGLGGVRSDRQPELFRGPAPVGGVGGNSDRPNLRAEPEEDEKRGSQGDEKRGTHGRTLLNASADWQGKCGEITKWRGSFSVGEVPSGGEAEYWEGKAGRGDRLRVRPEIRGCATCGRLALPSRQWRCEKCIQVAAVRAAVAGDGGAASRQDARKLDCSQIMHVLPSSAPFRSVPFEVLSATDDV